MVLISYENEVSHTHIIVIAPTTPPLQALPQLWRIDLIKDGDRSMDARLGYVRGYRPKGTVDFAGPSVFGGTMDDDLVLVPTQSAPYDSQTWVVELIIPCRNAEILIWDRETGVRVSLISISITHLYLIEPSPHIEGQTRRKPYKGSLELRFRPVHARFCFARRYRASLVNPDPHPVFERDAEPEPEREDTSHEPRRQETMTTEGTVADSGRSTLVPRTSEPQRDVHPYLTRLMRLH